MCISVPGRFHGFDLARELGKKGLLYCLVTSYPFSKTIAYGFNKKSVKTIISKELIIRGWHKLFGYYPDWFWINEWYDKCASFLMPMDADIYVLWAGFALHSIKKIKRKNPNAKIVLERGSTHIEEQNILLQSTGLKRSILNSIISKEKNEYDLVDIISVPSTFAANSYFCRGFSISKVKINPYGVDLNLFSPVEKINKNTDFIVGYVGTISKQKNCEGLIRSVGILVNKGYSVKLLIAGGIDKNSFPTDYLSKYSFIEYLGNVPQNKLPKVYQRMDVFVLNSIQDGFGMVLLQAMAAGICTIATSNTGGPDIIQNDLNGYIIPINNDIVLSEKLEQLLLDRKKCKNMGVEARKSAINGFSWEEYGIRAIKEYNALI
ncbi:MAG TPA: glycosyltransferase family 4 protein [Saprospiraceae bacterium]|nr:glycosyltransferase family 4 protein [Saprospiraceae bacterium]